MLERFLLVWLLIGCIKTAYELIFKQPTEEQKKIINSSSTVIGGFSVFIIFLFAFVVSIILWPVKNDEA